MKINNPLCQTYSPTIIQNSISKMWKNLQEVGG